MCPFDCTALAGSGKVGPVNQINHTSWVAIATPTGRPKSVRNRSVIELFGGVVCVVILPFWHFCWCRGFCHRTESDLFLFRCCEDLQFLIYRTHTDRLKYATNGRYTGLSCSKSNLKCKCTGFLGDYKRKKKEQDKSPDIEQQLPFGDRKAIHSLKIGGGVTKPTGTSYNFDKVWIGTLQNY